MGSSACFCFLMSLLGSVRDEQGLIEVIGDHLGSVGGLSDCCPVGGGRKGSTGCL